MNWEDARLFLAVARAGQMLAAARKLGLNQATLSRRMSALEKELETRLLVRRPNGSELTEDGRRLLAALEEAEGAFMQAEATLQKSDTQISGTVRIGAPDAFGVSFLAPRLGRLAERHPELAVQLVPLPRSFSLSQREADIAVMVGRPREGRLVARKLTDYTLGLYAAPAYLERYGTPRTAGDLAGHRLVGYVEDLIYTPSLNYAREFYPQWKNRLEIASATGQLAALRGGAGIGVLHDYLAREDPHLVPVLPALRARRAYWTVYHESLRNTARVRAAADFLADMVRASPHAFVREAA